MVLRPMPIPRFSKPNRFFIANLTRRRTFSNHERRGSHGTSHGCLGRWSTRQPLQPPWPLQAFCPLQECLSVLQPPLPLQAFLPLQVCLPSLLSARIRASFTPSAWYASSVTWLFCAPAKIPEIAAAMKIEVIVSVVPCFEFGWFDDVTKSRSDAQALSGKPVVTRVFARDD